LHAAAATEKPIRVIEDGQLVGVVDRARILESIAGAEDDAEAANRANGAGPADGVAWREGPLKVEPVNEPTQETAEFLVETGNPAEPRPQT
jgi:hypothetical protein